MVQGSGTWESCQRAAAVVAVAVSIPNDPKMNPKPRKVLFPEIGHVTKFQEQGPKNNPRQHNTTPGAARPPPPPPAARISRILGIMETSISNISRIVEITNMRFPRFPGYEQVDTIRFPIFPGFWSANLIFSINFAIRFSLEIHLIMTPRDSNNYPR